MRSRRVAEILFVVAGAPDERKNLPARLSTACLAALPVTGVGVALMTAAGPSGVVLAATDDRARELEELQFALGEGPCVEASASGRPVLQPDLEATGPARWPRFGSAVLAAGVRAIFAFPLRVGAVRIGVLDCYRDEPGRLEAADLAEALAYAEAVTATVLHLQRSDGLSAAIDSRAEVHQATGMIAVQLDIGVDDALLSLRAHAYATGRTVSAIAADVVGRRLTFESLDDEAVGP
jgi:hypothetical protein